MINFIKIDDISVVMNFQGEFKFDKRGVKNILTRNYVRFYTVEDEVNAILDDEILEDVTNTEELQEVLMKVVERLNEKFVPMMRHKRYSESYIPNYLDLTKFVHKDDIVIYRRRVSQGKNKDEYIVIEANLDMVFRNINQHKLSLKPEERDKILSDVENQIVEKYNKDFKGKVFDSWTDYSKEVESLKDEIYAKLVSSLVEYNEPVVLNYMMDNRINYPYFAYSEEKQCIVYTKDRVLYLLDALGFEVIEDDKVAITYLEEVCERQTNILKKEYGEAIMHDDMLLKNVSLIANIVILNNIVYAANNNIPLIKAIEYEAPEQLLSQIEIEQVYIDRCAEMMDFDYVLEDLSNIVSAPKSSIGNHVHDIINAVKGTYKDLVDNENPYDNIYRAVVFMYETEMKYKQEEINGASWSNISPHVKLQSFNLSDVYNFASALKDKSKNTNSNAIIIPNKYMEE